MRTKDFIKMLQEADPTGEMHITMPDGIPFAAEPKAGYWDGPYNYIDDDGNWVCSNQGDKLDIHCMEISDFVEEMFGSSAYNLPSWEDVESKFRFELASSSETQRKEREARILKKAMQTHKEKTEWRDKLRAEDAERACGQARDGWSWFQNKLVDNPFIIPNIHMYYTWKIYDGECREENSNVYNIDPILHSGFFERQDNGVLEGHYQWTLKK